VRFCSGMSSNEVQLGTAFDGLAFYSTNGYRSDLGEKMWVDEVVGE